MGNRMNSTVTLQSNSSESDGVFDSENWTVVFDSDNWTVEKDNMVFVATISILVMVTTCILYIIWKLSPDETSTERNVARLEVTDRSPMEMYYSLPCFTVPINYIANRRNSI